MKMTYEYLKVKQRIQRHTVSILDLFVVTLIVKSKVLFQGLYFILELLASGLLLIQSGGKAVDEIYTTQDYMVTTTLYR